MAAIEQLLISKVITDQSIEEVAAKGVQPKHFGGHYEDAWKWIVDYVSKHGDVPSERKFALAHANVTIEDTSTETTSGLVEELFDQYAEQAVAKGTADAVQALNKGDTDSALSALKEALDTATASTDVLRDTDLVENWLTRYEKYKARKAEERWFYGIHTGFPTLDELTGGFKAPNFILFVGEPKRGKSLYSLVSARAANEQSNKKVLYISFEMGVDEVATRYDALSSHLGVNALNNGDLSDRQLNHLHQELRLRQNKNPFIISEDQHRLTTPSAIRAKIIEHKPDIVFVDGLYMMRADETRRVLDERETLTQVTRACKFMAQELNITFVGTTQVLPGKVTGKKRKIESHTIGYTSSFIQDSDLILGCEKDEEDSTERRYRIRVVEGRNVQKDATIDVNWDWKTMDFTEIGPGDDEDDDAADYY
jgi:replicative DNA helicase